MRELTALDRCDQCVAQAFVEVHVAPCALLFCAHHYGEHELALLPYPVNDQRDRINAAPSQSATPA